mmetsp:Transcript_89605/g.280406  ORF Transcript_89605/g.280406 Transcript_89605/m.280406 type:complete len:755 (+) Transcript_89605:964-3228(+)
MGQLDHALQQLRLLVDVLEPAKRVGERQRRGFAGCALGLRSGYLLARDPAVDLQPHPRMSMPLQRLYSQVAHRLHRTVRAQRVVAHLGGVHVARELQCCPIALVDDRSPRLAVDAEEHHVLCDPLVAAGEQPAEPAELLLQSKVAEQLQQAVALVGVLASQDLAGRDGERRDVLAQGTRSLQGGVGLLQELVEEPDLCVPVAVLQVAVVQFLVREILDARGGFEGLVPRVHGHYDVMDQPHGRPLEDSLWRKRVACFQNLRQQLPGLLVPARGWPPPLGAHAAEPPRFSQVYLDVFVVGVLCGTPAPVSVRRGANAVEQSATRRSLGVGAGSQGGVRHLPAADSQRPRPRCQSLRPEVVGSCRGGGAADLQLDLLTDLRGVRAQLADLPDQVIQALHELAQTSVELADLAPGLELMRLQLPADERHREHELLADLLLLALLFLLLAVLAGLGRLRLLHRCFLHAGNDPAHVRQQRGQSVLQLPLQRVQVFELPEHGGCLPVGLLQQHPAGGTAVVVDLRLLAPTGDVVHHGVLAQRDGSALGGDTLLLRQNLGEVRVPVRSRSDPNATALICAQRLQLLHGQLYVAFLLQELQATSPLRVGLLDVPLVLLLQGLALLLVLARGVLLVLPGLLHELLHLVDLRLVSAGVSDTRGLLGQLLLQSLHLLLELGDVLGLLVLGGVDLDGLGSLGIVEGGERLVGVGLRGRQGGHHRGERVPAQGLLQHTGELRVPVRDEDLLVARSHHAQRVDDVPQR